MWIYILGETKGNAIKIGHTKMPTVAHRCHGVNSEQTTNENYVLLAAMRGNKIAESVMKKYFARYQCDNKGTKTEYFLCAEPLIEYVIWLRGQSMATTLDNTQEDEIPEEDHNIWIPDASRRYPRPPLDPEELPLPAQMGKDPLSGTFWAFLPNPLKSYQDFFTPPEIVRLAEQAMGGIDLDAASHFIANRRLKENGVHISDYYTRNRSAFDHDWKEKVWLNPPYGENERWLKRAEEMITCGKTRQLCWISPVWAFTTHVAKPLIHKAAAAILLSPTPAFYDPSEPTLPAGSNHPHAIFYWGNRRPHFLTAFKKTGIGFRLDESP